MILHIIRDVFSPAATLGVLTIDGKDGFFTCEDPPRDVKIKGVTCIPAGRYRVKTTWSPKYQRSMPLVCDVPGWKGIRIHSGNDADDSSGCILVGTVRTPTGVGHSRVACEWLYDAIAVAESHGQEVWVSIS